MFCISHYGTDVSKNHFWFGRTLSETIVGRNLNWQNKVPSRERVNAGIVAGVI